MTKGRYVEDCFPCPKNNYCPQGSETPKLCLRGYYCPPEVSEPQPCPIGTYGDSSGLGAIEECTNCTKGWYVQFKIDVEAGSIFSLDVIVIIIVILRSDV